MIFYILNGYLIIWSGAFQFPGLSWNSKNPLHPWFYHIHLTALIDYRKHHAVLNTLHHDDLYVVTLNTISVLKVSQTNTSVVESQLDLKIFFQKVLISQQGII